MSKSKDEIMRLLADGKEHYGLDLIKSSNILRRGTIYIHLATLEERGLITSRDLPPNLPGLLPRRVYRKV